MNTNNRRKDELNHSGAALDGVDIPTATYVVAEDEEWEQRIVDTIHAIQDARQKRAEVLMVERGISENEALEITFTEELPDVDH